MYILVDKETGEPYFKKDGTLFTYSTKWTAKLGKRWIESQDEFLQRFNIVEVGV